MSFRKDEEYEVDREKMCPFLLRVFYKENSYSKLEDLNNENFLNTNELHIYTWLDANLREITTLIKSAIDIPSRKETKFMFSFVYYDSKGKLQRKEVGDVYLKKNSPEELNTLYSLKFVIGDYIDIYIQNR